MSSLLFLLSLIKNQLQYMQSIRSLGQFYKTACTYKISDGFSFRTAAYQVHKVDDVE